MKLSSHGMSIHMKKHKGLIRVAKEPPRITAGELQKLVES